jgi:hypothetical protein
LSLTRGGSDKNVRLSPRMRTSDYTPPPVPVWFHGPFPVQEPQG